MQKFIKKVKGVLGVTVIVIFIMIILLTFLQILTRYLNIAVFPWTEEVTRLLLVWGGYFAICLVTAEKDHINIDFLFRKMPDKLKVFNNLFVDIIFLFFCFIAIYFGWKVCEVGWNDFNTALKYPRALFFTPIPVSCIFTLFFLLPDFYSAVKEILRNTKIKGV